MPAVYKLHEEVRQCTACPLRQEAVAPVPPLIGSEYDGVLFVGKAPGKDEDIRGLPFQGPSGEVLDQFLGWCGLNRKQIGITNLVLCHGLDDRDPTRDEVRTCANLWLKRYLAILEPFLVVTMGAPASKHLVGIGSMSADHGKLYWHKGGFWVVPCFHPAAVLHRPELRGELEFDAFQIKSFLENLDQYVQQGKARPNTAELNATRQDSSGLEQGPS